MQVPEETPSVPHAGPHQGPVAGGSVVPTEEARDLAFAVAMRLLVGHPNRRETAEELAQEAMLRIIRNKKPVRRSWRALVRTTVSRLVWTYQRDEGTQG